MHPQQLEHTFLFALTMKNSIQWILLSLLGGTMVERDISRCRIARSIISTENFELDENNVRVKRIESFINIGS